MATTITLAAAARPAGASPKLVRRRGGLPGVVYGHKVDSRAIETDAAAFAKVWHRAGQTQLIDLSLDGDRAQRVLVRDVQVSPRTGRPIHVDFFAVNLREKLTADVPIRIVGEAPAVVDTKAGQLLELLSVVHVECLPADVPAHIDADVSGLTEVDQSVHVRDLQLPEGVVLVHTDPDEVVVKVAALRVAADEEAAAAEATAAVASTEESSETSSEE
ncbi:MAG: 50S ribosomal protein L25 [Candidatus Dormibacteria bacterium]